MEKFSERELNQLNTARYWLAMPNAIVAFISLFINTFLIYALRKLKKLNTISFRFILLLSVSDNCASIALIVVELQIIIPGLWEKPEQYQVSFYEAFVYGFLQYSAFMTLSIGLDRYIHMRFLTRYNRILTNRRASILVLTNVIASVLLVTFSLTTKLSKRREIFDIFLNCFMTAYLLVLFAVYARAYKSLSTRTRQANLQNGLGQNNLTNIAPLDPNKQFAKAVFLILCGTIACYTPFIVCASVNVVFPHHVVISITKLFSVLILFCDCAVNSIIVILLTKEIKNYALQVIKCRFAANVEISPIRTRIESTELN